MLIGQAHEVSAMSTLELYRVALPMPDQSACANLIQDPIKSSRCEVDAEDIRLMESRICSHVIPLTVFVD